MSAPLAFRRLGGDSVPPFYFRVLAGDQLLWAWAGEWRTDVFALTPADVALYYAPAK